MTIQAEKMEISSYRITIENLQSFFSAKFVHRPCLNASFTLEFHELI